MLRGILSLNALVWDGRHSDYPTLFECCNFWAGLRDTKNELIAWIPRLEIILREGESKVFPQFDRYSHLNEMLSTWVVHDLTHIAQIVRVMAERYRADVGPWKEYLGILKN
ncbi:hypothetical protein [Brevibacillus laterosporus]|uniref:hypothetical protein n=1 Tax=Brevibacillus laterosporus TaxID=1465 RepID=UPI001F54BC5C|nr:hypothetical protein [Brevibacillus laterosporus]